MIFNVWSTLLVASVVNFLKFFLIQLPVEEGVWGEVFMSIVAVAISWVMYLDDLWSSHDQ